MRWRSVVNTADDIINVVPDDSLHELGEDCWCRPLTAVLEDSGSLLISHNDD